MKLTHSENHLLLDCEIKIEKGLKTFIEVGEALLTIRTKNLYRQQYKTFEDYCLNRWNIGVRQSQRLINAVGVVHNLNECDQSVALPKSEYQIRSLAGLSPEAQKEIWEKVNIEQEAVTGKVVLNAVQTFTGKSEPGKYDLHFSSNSGEWYTPEKVIKPTLKLFGAIDLDPCSNSKESPTIPATNHFTIKDDGLSHKWEGKVYLNPPYGIGIKEWIQKLILHYKRGDISEAIALLPARTDTNWFSLLRELPRCFIKGKLHFSGADNPAPFPSVIVYLGRNQSGFIKHFELIGDIYFFGNHNRLSN